MAETGEGDKRVVPVTDEEQAEVAGERIKEFERRLMGMPKGRPFERGVLRFNLAVAYAESPMGERQSNLGKALASIEQAVKLFDAVTKPIEHARAQNVRGSTLRELGRPEEAIDSFETAIHLVPANINPGEHGAPMNNLGLAFMDLGRFSEAAESFEKALAAFEGPTFLRQRVDVLHNLGQALSATEEPEGYAKGIEQYLEALDITDPQEFPYQWALLHNSMGVAYTGAGEPEKAAEAFQAALRVYTRSRWPFQYAIAKNNVAMANIQIGTPKALRLAVASCEDALTMLDVRMHRDQWQQVFKNLELAEKGLKELGEQGTRTEHFARLLAGEGQAELIARLRERVSQYTTMPDPRRSDVLTELDLAILSLPDAEAQRVNNAWLTVLMEQPHEEFVSGLHGRMRAHSVLEDAARERATRILDFTIQNELLAPQRIRVRDTLYALGYERPESAEGQQ